MTHLNIPVGISDFAEIRQNGYYYVDKTGLIAEVLKAQAVKVTLITRPRRFGKTLGMSTLENFFSIRKDSAVLFQGLGIMNASALCQKWMNQCPTIFLSFKDVDGLTFDSAYGMLEATIAEFSEENLWSILYLTGYLTGVRGEDQTTKLMIPNAEIREIFESTVVKWFQDKAQGTDRRTLFHAVWNGDSELLTREMSTLLRMTISYHDYKEDFYHAFLAGIFAGAGYMVESNREHGEGRSDVIVCDSENGRLAVFEVKCSAALEKMEESCETALRQIDERMYAKEFEDSYDQVLCYGISFYKKRCLVKKIHS